MSGTEEKYNRLCVMVSEEFIRDPKSVLDLAKEIAKDETFDTIRKSVDLKTFVVARKSGNMSDDEFLRSVRFICFGGVEKSREQSRKERGKAKRELRKRQETTGNIKVVCNLDGQIYHNNKGRFHELAEKYGLSKEGGWVKDLNAATLNMRARDAKESIFGFFIREGKITKSATLTWRGNDRTPLAVDFVNVCVDLGGEIDDKELRRRGQQKKLF